MELPQKVGRYEVEKSLGQGGMGLVYLARDPFMHRRVAVKILPRPSRPEDTQVRARFEREARIIAELEHPAIVPVYDFGYHEAQPFIVMRYMLGGTLRDKMDGTSFSPQEVLRVLRQITPALDYVHEKEIVHRDLKPANILFDQAGNAFVGDFGIAKISAPTINLTGSGLIGTPAYMSPEQIQGREDIDCRSDVYAMAVMVFELLTGKTPYDVDTPIGLAMAHLLNPIPDVLALNPELLPPYQKFFYHALAKEPNDRIDSMGSLLRAIEKAEQERATYPPETVDGIKTQKTEDVTFSPPKAETIQSLDRPPEIQQPENKGVLQEVPLWFWVISGVLGILILIILGMDAFSGFTPTPTPATPTQAIAAIVLTETSTLTKTPTRLPTLTKAPTFSPTPSPTPTITTTPTETPFPTQIVDEFGVPMVLILAGTFQMGTNGDIPNEEPEHTVYLDAYYLDQYEVTNERYAACVEAGACMGRNASELDSAAHAQYPVRYINWDDAHAYCEWRNAQLPTEAQWEKAAKGGSGQVSYPWGNEDPVCEIGAFNGGQYSICSGAAVPVGTFSPNGYGLYDMAGNVWEWVADWYASDYYDLSPENNPAGPETGESRILRGGSWTDVPQDLRTTRRFAFSPLRSSVSSGIRCARFP